MKINAKPQIEVNCEIVKNDKHNVSFLKSVSYSVVLGGKTNNGAKTVAAMQGTSALPRVKAADMAKGVTSDVRIVRETLTNSVSDWVGDMATLKTNVAKNQMIKAIVESVMKSVINEANSNDVEMVGAVKRGPKKGSKKKVSKKKVAKKVTKKVAKKAAKKVAKKASKKVVKKK